MRTKDSEIVERFIEWGSGTVLCVCVGDHYKAVCHGGVVCVCACVGGWWLTHPNNWLEV